jgi:hypothetical protein
MGAFGRELLRVEGRRGCGYRDRQMETKVYVSEPVGRDCTAASYLAILEAAVRAAARCGMCFRAACRSTGMGDDWSGVQRL